MSRPRYNDTPAIPAGYIYGAGASSRGPANLLLKPAMPMRGAWTKPAAARGSTQSLLFR
jgi:hypothetical protein